MKIEHQITLELKEFDNNIDYNHFMNGLSSDEKADWFIVPENPEEKEIEVSRHYQKHLNNQSRIESLERKIKQLENEGTVESDSEVQKLKWQIKKLRG